MHHSKPETSGTAPLGDLIGCTVKEACARTGLKPTTLYGLMKDGAVESTKVGRRRIIVVRSLRRLIEGDKAVAAEGERAS